MAGGYPCTWEAETGSAYCWCHKDQKHLTADEIDTFLRRKMAEKRARRAENLVCQFPERIANLVQGYLDTALEDILSNISEWENKFSEITISLDANELTRLSDMAHTRVYQKPGYVEPDEAEIILLFFLLKNAWAHFRCRPAGLVKGAQIAIKKADGLSTRCADKGDAIIAAVRDDLRRLFNYSILNKHSLLTIIGNEQLSFEENFVVFFDGCRENLHYLLNVYESSLESLMSVWALKDKVPRSALDDFLDDWCTQITDRWPRLRRHCLEAWKTSFTPAGFKLNNADVGPEQFLRAFPPAVDDVDWVDWCVSEFVRRCAMSDGFGIRRISTWLNCIKQFRSWSGSTAKRLFDAADALKENLPFEAVKNILSPDSLLSDSDRVCIALTFLTHEHNRFAEMRDGPSEDAIRTFESQKDFIANMNDGEAVLSIFSRLQDLPTQTHGHSAVWREFGPDEKAAWRAEIVEVLSGLINVRHGLSEHLLWQTSRRLDAEHLYSEMELLVLNLCTIAEDVQFLRGLRNHVSRIVCVRTMALLARLGDASAPSPFVPLPDDKVTTAAASQALAMLGDVELPHRTWMQDRAVERVIYNAVQEVEKEFVAEYESQWRLDEEMHLATILARLQHALRGSNGILDALAAYGVAIAPRIEFSFRQITKHEEGGTGVGSDRFSVDVAFIIRVTDEGRILTKRATFVQCKKLEANDGGGWKPTFDFNRSQCDDVIKQTEASFYMFLSPAFVRHEIWMAPARLVRNLVDLGGARGRLPRAPTFFASRSLAHWITYDLFGLWTGDERIAVLDKAAGAKPGWAPRFVITVVIHRHPTHDEAPDRSGLR